MNHYLEDNPFHTTSFSLDLETLQRLNDICRRSPELGSRSQLVRELLNLGMDLLEHPMDVLPALVSGIRDNLEAVALHEAESAGTA